ncbi:peptide/nickel transport system substrate-binding protein [Evansella vedderi]|uniref:Peptide/nickel transport system substrate-binding protein n=1 Tax=Evansella vedderi TaxID=38282 RepID=A0ABU0A3W8_9BACI|nr:peptide-binding protein [Evansella vedderi]MDQ0257799.1 peptide/nickel transport system substrate-binding protein [Evansella vedderi]
MKTTKSLLMLISMILMLSLFVVACGGNGEDASVDTDDAEQGTGESEGTEDDGEEETTGEPREGGSIVLGTSGEPVIFNSLYHSDSASADVTDLVFAGLTYTNENLEVQPLIAKSDPEISEDGLEWTYEMHEGVLFHDGEEVTAHDVVFTFEIFLHEDYTGPRASNFETLVSVEAIDDYTVKFTLSEVDAAFPTRVGYGILPKHLLEDVPVADLEDYREFNIDQPIGAGPFKFVEWVPGQNLQLEAFDDYFEGRPYLDNVTFRFASDSNALVLLLETGDIDHMIAPTSEIATIETYDHVNLSSVLALRYDYIGWNLDRPLFEDVRVRQALTHAIDRQEIVETIMEGQAEVADAPVSPLSWAYNDDVPAFDYDPDRAIELLNEAGWEHNDDGIMEKDGEIFEFTILSNDGNTTRRDIGIIVQQYLNLIGIKVHAEQMEWGAFLDQINPPNFDFDAIVMAWGLALDPDPTAIWHSKEIENGLNRSAYRNDLVDELSDLNTTILDQDERAEVLGQIYAQIAEDQPYTFLFYPQQFVAMNKDIKGFTHHPRVDMYKVHEWWLDN